MIAATYRLSGVDMVKPITSDAQNRQYVAEILSMQDRNLTSVEKARMEVLILLVAAYEKKRFKLPAMSPVDVLITLMQENKLSRADLLDIFPTKSIASMVLNGKRPIKSYIRKLSERFKVSPELFYER
jgi:HTH-type transcriptional regulator / antitoxin HigA